MISSTSHQVACPIVPILFELISSLPDLSLIVHLVNSTMKIINIFDELASSAYDTESYIEEQVIMKYYTYKCSQYPCGTPCGFYGVTGILLNEDTYCFLPVKYERMRKSIEPIISYNSSLSGSNY